MPKWLIVHDLESFIQNPNTIGFAVKRGLDGQQTMGSDQEVGNAY